LVSLDKNLTGQADPHGQIPQLNTLRSSLVVPVKQKKCLVSLDKNLTGQADRIAYNSELRAQRRKEFTARCARDAENNEGVNLNF
jgi:hypothetical protein